MTTRNRELASIIDDSGNITAGGNLTVSGTTLTASSTVETHADPLIELNTGAGSNANDLGFVFERGSTGDNAALIWDESNDGFLVGTTTATGTSTGNMSVTAGDFAAGKVTVDSVLINGTTIGHTSDTDLLTLADGLLTVAGEVSMTTLDIGGTNVTSTAAELNILDGVSSTAAELNILDGVTATAAEINFLDGDTSATGTTLAAADRVIVNDAGTMKQVALSDFETFFESDLDTFTNISVSGTLGVTGVISATTHIDLPDNAAARFGTGSDMQIYHNGSHAYLTNTEGVVNAWVDTSGTAIYIGHTTSETTVQDNLSVLGTLDVAGAVVFNEGSADVDFRVESNGNANMLFVDGGNDRVGIGTATPASKLHIQTSTNFNYEFEEVSSKLRLSALNDARSANVPLQFAASSFEFLTGGATFAGTLGVTGVISPTTHIDMPDNAKLLIGTGDDLEIYHDASDSYIKDVGTGNLFIDAANNLQLRSASDSAQFATFASGGGAILYFAGSSKLATETGGINITGDTDTDTLTVSGNATVGGTLGVTGVISPTTHIDMPDDAWIKLGTGDDLNLYHDASNSYISDTGTGNLILKSSTTEVHGTDGGKLAGFYSQGRAALYYNNTEALRTVSGGVEVTGYMDADNFKVNGGQGSDGQVLTSTGSGVAWEAAGGVSALDGLSDAVSGITNFTNSLIIGHQTTGTLDSADGNTAVGYAAMAAITSGDDNVAVGYAALGANTTGAANTAVGSLALDASTTGSHNTALGYGAMSTTTTGSFCTAVGRDALSVHTSGADNTAVGYATMQALTTGTNNVAMGNSALTALTTTAGNTAIGKMALTASVTGSYNTALGYLALTACLDGGNNVAVGYNALTANTDGANNVAVGHAALGICTTGATNVAVGRMAHRNLTSGSNNTAIGDHAANAITTGGYNVVIGQSAGSSGVGLTTGSQNVIIGDYSHTSAVDSANQLVMGYNVVGSGNGTITVGNATSDSTMTLGGTTWSAPSDIRLKEDIQDAEAGLSFINALRPVTYRWKKEKDIPEELNAHVADSEKRTMNDKVNHGFVAQEVKEVIDNHPEIKDGFEMWREDDTDGRQRIGEGALVTILTKAVQELSTMVEELKLEIITLKGE